MCEKSEERPYYLRTNSMYTDLTREVLFKVFEYLIKSEDIAGFLSSLEQQNILRELIQRNVINQSDYNLVSCQDLNLERLDISLLIKLILNLCKENIPQPQGGWEIKPHPKDKSLGADLLRLRDVENKMIVQADAKFSVAEYEKTWANIIAILLRVLEVVDSQSSENFERRINEYKQLNKDTQNAEVKRRMDELLNFKSEFEHLQEKVEELSRRSNEFQEYFKTIPKRFVRYIKLLFDGGRIVLYGIMKTKLGDQDLLDFLERKKEMLIRNIDEKFSGCLYSEESCSDYKNWDVYLLASILLLMFDNDLSQREIMYIKHIKSARVNYAALALQSLDTDDFLTHWTDLIMCLNYLSNNIAKDDKKQVKYLIELYNKTDGGCDDEEYLEQLKESGDEVKTLNDVYKETITELKDMLNQLSRKNIKFKQKQVLEFKLLTICESGEFKKKADDLLQASIQQLDQPPDSIRKEMDKLVAILAAHPDVEVKQECIVLSFKCSTPGDLIHILDVTQSDQFRSTLQNIANELHYIYGYAFLIQGKCTLESVLRVSTMINESTTNETSSDEISIPLKCSSVNGIRSVLSAVNLEKTTNSLNTITELMSAEFNEPVSIQLIPGMMEFRNVFEETDEMETEVVQEHEVGEQWYEEIMNEYAVENKEPEGNIKTIRGTFQATQNHTKDVIVGEKRTENELGKEEGIPKKIRILDDYGRQDEVKRNQGVSYLQTKEEIYQKCKKELQDDLIKFYRQNCSSIPLSPLLEEIETPLAGFYVMPDIVDVKQKSLTRHEEEKTPIKSLKDLFSTGSGYQQEIYLSADAGFGKTAFSKYLAIMWCQAHYHDENYACFKDDELKMLFDFEFLFLVLLRNCISVCNIEDMIELQITTYRTSSATLHKILSREKCLIILDGLDEWSHPNSCSQVTETIPHRHLADNCVILTTTRPWKLGVSKFKKFQVDKKVELVQLSADSTLQLEENAIRKMTGVCDNRVLKSKTQDFNKMIHKRGLEHMQVIPLLLMYIVGLWCNNIPMGNSKLEVYTNIIEFLLSRTSKKHPEVLPSCESSTSEIPEYFKSREFCKRFYSLITSLAELAYQTLFNESRGNTLVFDITVAEKYLKADDMKLSLLSGIMSESRSKTLIKEIIKLSFLHKTFQEFFAAIFISSQSDAQKTVVEKCRNVQDILDMSNIYEFISEMNADQMCTISNGLMSVINEDQNTHSYRTRTGLEIMHNNPLYDIQKMFMSCLQEMPESENIQLCLQDFFIDEDTEHSEHLQLLFKQNKTNIKSLYINTINTSSSLCEIIDLFSLTDLGHIQNLFYYGDRYEEAEIDRILFPSLEAFTLRNGKWTHSEENLSENLAQCQNLQYLDIFNFTLSHKILETFFNFISQQKTMKELTLASLNCEEHGCKRLNLDFSHHTTLSMLFLGELPGRLQVNISTPSLVNVTLIDINLDESSLVLSRDMLHIERVELEEVEMSAGSLQYLICVLVNLPQSVTVKMSAIKPETEYERVRKNIRRSQTCHVIEDGDWFGTFVFKTRKSGMMDTKWI